MTFGRVLHVGSGTASLPYWLIATGCAEVRLDIDPKTKPDIVASMTDIGEVETRFDAVYCNHSLEHLYPHEVAQALSEFWRVLEPGGWAIITVPDLEDARPTNEVLFVSEAGPITGLDLYYGHRASLPKRPYMAHHTGFTSATLTEALETARFDVSLVQRQSDFNLFGIGRKP